MYLSAVKLLRDIKEKGTSRPLYNIDHKLVNTMELTGIPQNRPRVYLVGCYRSLMHPATSFDWPGPVPMTRLSAFLGPNKLDPAMPTNTYHMKNLLRLIPLIEKDTGDDPRRVMYALDLDTSETFSPKMFMKERSPCLTRSRCGQGSFFLSSWQRKMSMTELRKLQGFPSTLRRPVGVSERALSMMFGNAMTVPLLARIQRMVLGAAKLIDLDVIEDPVAK